MELMELATKRRSVRAYAPKQVDREKLDELAEALRMAPSACNLQPWKIIFVDDPELKDSVALAAFDKTINLNRFAIGAPVMAVIVVETPRLINRIGAALKGREFPLIDIGLAASQLALRAVEMGLGTCLLGWFDERKIKKLLGIPARLRIGLLVTIGYPATETVPAAKQRKSLDEVRTFNAY